jgi:hypothetical protein
MHFCSDDSSATNMTAQPPSYPSSNKADEVVVLGSQVYLGFPKGQAFHMLTVKELFGRSFLEIFSVSVTAK